MGSFKFGDFQSDIDTQEYEFQLKIESDYANMTAEIEKIKSENRSDYIKGYCRAVFSFFNAVFGEGTDKKMFGDKTNMRICDDAIYSFSIALADDMKEYQEHSLEQVEAINKTFNALDTAKNNRTQRRAKK